MEHCHMHHSRSDRCIYRPDQTMEFRRHRASVESCHGWLESEKLEWSNIHPGGLKLLQRAWTDALRRYLGTGWLRLLCCMQQRQSSGWHVHSQLICGNQQCMFDTCVSVVQAPLWSSQIHFGFQLIVFLLAELRHLWCHWQSRRQYNYPDGPLR